MDVYKYIKDNNIDQLMSATNDLDFRTVIQVLNINTAVEIGTYHGSSAAYIAQFASKVHCFDIEDFPEKYKIWQDCEVINKIEFHLIKDKEEIKQILSTIKFDFAFIDNGHSYEECKADFELVKQCGRVLFHDVVHHLFPGVRKFTDELGNVKILLNNGYWSIDI